MTATIQNNVINIAADSGVRLPAGQVPGSMQVYCVSSDAEYGVELKWPHFPPPTQWYRISAGQMHRIQVGGYEVGVYNLGPSRIQLLLVQMELDGVAPEQVPGVGVLTPQ